MIETECLKYSNTKPAPIESVLMVETWLQKLRKNSPNEVASL